ncbi:hypothetical protein BD289DRAFT_427325 [Coniella lustricola]|uniref:Uncharacterized protein n=1 Tax=Coniella lustricola TaxID=2025994 RepID=A0A2T3AFH7_9PEZI|nr:hypothetical protein BD289DRAFT_427325 [Coniella lustricola]
MVRWLGCGASSVLGWLVTMFNWVWHLESFFIGEESEGIQNDNLVSVQTCWESTRAVFHSVLFWATQSDLLMTEIL